MTVVIRTAPSRRLMLTYLFFLPNSQGIFSSLFLVPYFGFRRVATGVFQSGARLRCVVVSQLYFTLCRKTRFRPPLLCHCLLCLEDSQFIDWLSSWYSSASCRDAKNPPSHLQTPRPTTRAIWPRLLKLPCGERWRRGIGSSQINTLNQPSSLIPTTPTCLRMLRKSPR